MQVYCNITINQIFQVVISDIFLVKCHPIVAFYSFFTHLKKSSKADVDFFIPGSESIMPSNSFSGGLKAINAINMKFCYFYLE